MTTAISATQPSAASAAISVFAAAAIALMALATDFAVFTVAREVCSVVFI